MCGRFTLRTPAHVLMRQFDVAVVAAMPALPERYNVAPSQTVLAVRATKEGQARELAELRWGLVPSWADDPAVGNQLVNARSETAAEKPAFREAFRRRRCLIPADGFYEWQRAARRRQPYLVQLREGGLFALAGLWEYWRVGEETIQSCTVLTTEANAKLRQLHDRMPVILAPEDYATWLDRQIDDPARLQPLLRPFPDERLALEPVSFKVNSPAIDDPSCLERAEQEQKTLF